MPMQSVTRTYTDQQSTNAALAALAAAGNAFALGQLWEINRGLLRSLFWKWYPSHREQADAHGLTADDFEQEGFFAVQYAAETYDPAKGFAFTTWLASAMQRQIGLAMSNGHRRHIIGEDGKRATVSADPLNHCTSLDLPLDAGGDDSETLGDLQPDPAAAGEMLEVEEKLYHEQLHYVLEEAMEKLTTQEGAVLRRIYYAGHTLQQIGTDEGLSFQRVQQIKNTAFRKLRNNPRLRRWRDEVISSHAWHSSGFGAWSMGGSVEERTVEYLEAHGAYCVQ